MQVVILAGGRGIRLRPFTDKVPKPMALFSDKPFLQYQMEMVKAFGVTEIVILAGYLGQQIKDYFGDGSRLGLNLQYSFENTLMGTAGALKNTEAKLKEEFLLLNGDTYLPIDYSLLIDVFRRQNKMGIVAAYENKEKAVANNLAIDSAGQVVAYNKKDSSGMSHIDAGAMIFRKDILGLIPKDKIYSLEEEVFPQLIAAKQLAAFSTNQRFYDMGSINGLKILEGILK